MGKHIKYVLVLFCALGFVTLSGCNLFRTKIDITPYLTYQYDGIDGYTSLEMNLDLVTLKNDFMDKISKKKIEKYEELLNNTTIKASKTENLRNGDSIQITLVFDAQLEKQAGVLFKNTEVEFVVEGLEYGELIDLFQDISLNVQGIAPYASLTVVNNSANPYIQSLEFVAEPSFGFHRGDVIKLTCNATLEGARAQHFVYLEDEKFYNTTNVEEYLSSLEQLDYETLSIVANDAVNTVKRVTEDNQNRMLYTLTKKSNFLFQYNKEWVESIELLEAKLLTGNGVDEASGEIVPINRLYLIFKAYVTNADYGSDGYFCFEYSNIISKPDGSNLIHFENQEQRYLCDLDYTNLMERVMQKQKGTYTEQNVDISFINVQNN